MARWSREWSKRISEGAGSCQFVETFRASEFLGSLPMSSPQAYVPLSSSAISPQGTAAQWFDLSSLGCIRLVG